MKNILIVGALLVAGFFAFRFYYRTPAVHTSSTPVPSEFSEMYTQKTNGFSIYYKKGYTVDESYVYQMNPEKMIAGVKFTIPASMKAGTNLSTDTALSVEQIADTETCSADLFLDGPHTTEEKTENGTTYSFAATADAGAGNRYEETVYALVGTHPCRAVRYFIHYTNIQNYDPGTIREFDRSALLKEFDAMRKTLVVSQ